MNIFNSSTGQRILFYITYQMLVLDNEFDFVLTY